MSFSGGKVNEFLSDDTPLDIIVRNCKLAIEAKTRALKDGKYKDIKEFRERIEYNDTFLDEFKKNKSVTGDIGVIDS